MMKLFLVFVGAILVVVEGTEQTEMLRVVMGLYLGMTIFCFIAAFTPAWRHVAAIWAVFFLYSIAAGRILRLIVDGTPSPIRLFYMAVELIGGTLGLLVLARETHDLLRKVCNFSGSC